METAKFSQTLSAEAEALLAAIRAQGFPGWSFMTIAQARGMMTTLKALAGQSGFSGKTEDVQLSQAPDVTARVYTPSGNARCPVLVYLHGGGWVAGDAEAYDGCMRRLASVADIAIVSVNYRLAPEHKHPAALDDAYMAVEWARDHAAVFGWAAEKVVVGGDSAGANLAAAVCLRCRDRKGPPIAMQLLISPILDHDFATESHVQFHNGPIALTHRDILWFQSHYLNGADELDSPEVSPLRGDLAGVPRAVIIAAGIDPLRDDALNYGERLRLADVEAETRVYDGMFHGFWMAPAILPQAEEAFRFAASRLAEI